MSLVLDFETTDLLPKGVRLTRKSLPQFPRVVQVSWHYKEKIKTYYVIPEDFEIPQASINIHGITTKKATDEGIQLNDMLDILMPDIIECKTFVAHNATFDHTVLLSELLRLDRMKDYYEVKNTNVLCTMKSSAEWCQIDFPRESRWFGSKYKWPSLSELHYKCFGKDFANAHDAESDVKATVACLQYLQSIGKM